MPSPNGRPPPNSERLAIDRSGVEARRDSKVPEASQTGSRWRNGRDLAESNRIVLGVSSSSLPIGISFDLELIAISFGEKLGPVFHFWLDFACFSPY